MTRRNLSPDEAALWARVLATVEPLKGQKAAVAVAAAPVLARKPEPAKKRPEPPQKRPEPVSSGTTKPPVSANTLDGGWDRRLGKGAVQPDVTVDLHGHNLATAYARLDQSLAMAIAAQHRIILLITGKPRKEGEYGGRGAIRAAVADWLASSRHAGQIAAVRNAHPRHGGEGALYIILKRKG